MSELPKGDPRLDQASATDESILDAHELVLGRHPDDGGRYRLLPIAILFVLSGLILFSGTYLNRYTGHYSPLIFNENAKPVSGTAAVPKADPMVVGKAAFASVCITCHQPTGMGMPGIYPPLNGSEWVNGSPDRVIRIVLYGLKGDIHVTGKMFNAAAMPVFGKVPGSAYNWSDDKIAAVLTYVRQTWDNKSAPITGDQVTAIHNAVGNRAEMSEAELNEVK
jgi:mono/diheme cytochrome c family protein